MSTTEKYVHSLKQIKETEDKVQKDIDEQKKKVAEDLRSFESNTSKTIVTAQNEGEKLVEDTIEQARKKATLETKKILEEAKNNSKTISSKIDTQTVHDVIDILLKEV